MNKESFDIFFELLWVGEVLLSQSKCKLSPFLQDIQLRNRADELDYSLEFSF